MAVVSGNVPKHLVSTARTGFLSALPTIELPWQKVAMTVTMDQKNIDLVDLGATPMPTERKGPFTVQDLAERTMEIRPRDWDITIALSYNAVQDDQTGDLEKRARGAARNFQRHINNRVFTALNAGDGTTYGSAYNGLAFFYDSHVDAGAAYQTAQDNCYAVALSIDNFETVWVAAQAMKDDQGEEQGYNYNQLVVSPALYREAANIVRNEWAYDTANHERNPWGDGMLLDPIVSPKFDSAAWALIASDEEIKPMLVAMREEPHLQTQWFDPATGEGGMYYFKYYARYDVFYGDWRLAMLGHT